MVKECRRYPVYSVYSHTFLSFLLNESREASVTVTLFNSVFFLFSILLPHCLFMHIHFIIKTLNFAELTSPMAFYMAWSLYIHGHLTMTVYYTTFSYTIYLRCGHKKGGNNRQNRQTWDQCILDSLKKTSGAKDSNRPWFIPNYCFIGIAYSLITSVAPVHTIYSRKLAAPLHVRRFTWNVWR